MDAVLNKDTYTLLISARWVTAVVQPGWRRAEILQPGGGCPDADAGYCT